jgi:hypothetical protein
MVVAKPACQLHGGLIARRRVFDDGLGLNAAGAFERFLGCRGGNRMKAHGEQPNRMYREGVVVSANEKYHRQMDSHAGLPGHSKDQVPRYRVRTLRTVASATVLG